MAQFNLSSEPGLLVKDPGNSPPQSFAIVWEPDKLLAAMRVLGIHDDVSYSDAAPADRLGLWFQRNQQAPLGTKGPGSLFINLNEGSGWLPATESRYISYLRIKGNLAVNGSITDPTKVPLDGSGVMSGPVVRRRYALADLTDVIDGAAGTNREISFRTNSKSRVSIGIGGDPEDGTNAGTAGSSFYVVVFNNIGQVASIPLQIGRDGAFLLQQAGIDSLRRQLSVPTVVPETQASINTKLANTVVHTSGSNSISLVWSGGVVSAIIDGTATTIRGSSGTASAPGIDDYVHTFDRNISNPNSEGLAGAWRNVNLNGYAAGTGVNSLTDSAGTARFVSILWRRAA